MASNTTTLAIRGIEIIVRLEWISMEHSVDFSKIPKSVTHLFI